MSHPIAEQGNAVHAKPAQQLDICVEMTALLVGSVIIALGLALRQKYSFSTTTQAIIFTSGGIPCALALLSISIKCLPPSEYDRALHDLKNAVDAPSDYADVPALRIAIERLGKNCQTPEHVRACKDFILQRIKEGDDLLLPLNSLQLVTYFERSDTNHLLNAAKMGAVVEICKAANDKSPDPRFHPQACLLTFNFKDWPEEHFSKVVQAILDFEGNLDAETLKRCLRHCITFNKSIYAHLIIEKLSQEQCQEFCDTLCREFYRVDPDHIHWIEDMIIYMIQSKNCVLTDEAPEGLRSGGFLYEIGYVIARGEDVDQRQKQSVLRILQAAGLNPSDYGLQRS